MTSLDRKQFLVLIVIAIVLPVTPSQDSGSNRQATYRRSYYPNGKVDSYYRIDPSHHSRYQADDGSRGQGFEEERYVPDSFNIDDYGSPHGNGMFPGHAIEIMPPLEIPEYGWKEELGSPGTSGDRQGFGSDAQERASDPTKCGDITINPAHSVCCNGLVYRKTSADTGKCCGSVAYDDRYFTCCQGRAIVRKNGQLPLCCGDYSRDSLPDQCRHGYEKDSTGLGSTCCKSGNNGWQCCIKGGNCCSGHADRSTAIDVPGFRPACCQSGNEEQTAQCCSSTYEKMGILPDCCNTPKLKPVCCQKPDGTSPLRCCPVTVVICCRRDEVATQYPPPEIRSSYAPWPSHPVPTHPPVWPTRPPVWPTRPPPQPSYPPVWPTRPPPQPTHPPVWPTRPPPQPSYPPVWPTRPPPQPTHPPLWPTRPPPQPTHPPLWPTRPPVQPTYPPRPSHPPQPVYSTSFVGLSTAAVPSCCKSKQPPRQCCSRSSSGSGCCQKSRPVPVCCLVIFFNPACCQKQMTMQHQMQDLHQQHQQRQQQQDQPQGGGSGGNPHGHNPHNSNGYSHHTLHDQGDVHGRQHNNRAEIFSSSGNRNVNEVAGESRRGVESSSSSPERFDGRFANRTNLETNRPSVTVNCCHLDPTLAVTCCRDGYKESGRLPACCVSRPQEHPGTKHSDTEIAYRDSVAELQELKLGGKGDPENTQQHPSRSGQRQHSDVQQDAPSGETNDDGAPRSSATHERVCAGTTFDAEEHICCNNALRKRIGVSPACCDSVAYDEFLYKCCDGKVRISCNSDYKPQKSFWGILV